jgi:hypothetical protein
MTRNMKGKLKVWIGIGILIIIVCVGYFAGYRIGSFGIGKLGAVTLTIPVPQTSLFIDQSQKIQTEKENETITVKLTPTVHQVIVSTAGYFPWTKDFKIKSGEQVTLSPLFVAQNTSGSIIGASDPEYWKIKNAIASDILPSLAHPLYSTDKSSTLWVENNAILVKTQIATTTVIQPDTEIKNVSFYKDRNDVVVFSTNNTVYAIEVESDGTQNFMPIYKGTSPAFIESDLHSIYIEDNGALMQVAI